MDNTIGNKLKSLRENKKLTLDEVAKKLAHRGKRYSNMRMASSPIYLLTK